MIKELVYAVKYVLGKDLAGRDFTVFPDDTFIVSYPRSGNTWTRFLIANLIHQDGPVAFENIESIIPDTCVHSKRYLKRIPRPRILKSHWYFDPRYKKVVYIVRDPRDVALSLYYFQMKFHDFDESYPIARYVTRFVAGEVTDYGSWGENTASWLATRRSDHTFLLLRYEDMLAHPERELSKVASFMGIEANSERLAKAVEKTSAQEMQQLEKKQSRQWITTKKSRQDIPFVRAAGAGGWKTGLPGGAVAEIESAWGPLMKQLGYEPVSMSAAS